MMKSAHFTKLNSESRNEYGSLLILDHLMRYELPKKEKNNLQKTIQQLEEQVVELNKGFFHTDEQEQELNFVKDELYEAKDAMEEIEKEVEENKHCRINLAVFEHDNSSLEPLLKFMEERGTLSISKDNYYLPTAKGEAVYQNLVEQLEAYVLHFDVFAYVDLEQGIFGDPEIDLLEGDQWSDLRIAVAEHKGIDPYRVVFLAFLSEEKFYENPEWKFDLNLGTLFDEIEETVLDQIRIEDLGYIDGEEQISGDTVIKDVIKQGNSLTKERILQKGKLDQKQLSEVTPDEQIITQIYNY